MGTAGAPRPWAFPCRPDRKRARDADEGPACGAAPHRRPAAGGTRRSLHGRLGGLPPQPGRVAGIRSEEHTSELQSRLHLVCRLLLEKKNNIHRRHRRTCNDDKRHTLSCYGTRPGKDTVYGINGRIIREINYTPHAPGNSAIYMTLSV